MGWHYTRCGAGIGGVIVAAIAAIFLLSWLGHGGGQEINGAINELVTFIEVLAGSVAGVAVIATAGVIAWKRRHPAKSMTPGHLWVSQQARERSVASARAGHIPPARAAAPARELPVSQNLNVHLGGASPEAVEAFVRAMRERP